MHRLIDMITFRHCVQRRSLFFSFIFVSLFISFILFFNFCRWRTLEHYLNRCSLTIELLHRLDLIHRTAELARLFGIQFYDVLARGSQVSSLILFLSKLLKKYVYGKYVNVFSYMHVNDKLYNQLNKFIPLLWSDFQ